MQKFARGGPACVSTHPLTCPAQQWSDSFSLTKWMTVLGQRSHRPSFTVNHEMHRLHLRLRKPRKLVALRSSAADYWLYILQTCFISKRATLGEVSELCCCYLSLHAGIPPPSLLFSHTFFSSPSPLVSLPSLLRPLSASVVMCWILSKQILLLWPEPRKIFPEGLTWVLVTHIPCWQLGFFKIASHCEVAVTFHSAQFLTLYYQSSVVL